MQDLTTRLLKGDLTAAPRILTLLEKGHPQANEILTQLSVIPATPVRHSGEGRNPSGSPPSESPATPVRHSGESRNPSGSPPTSPAHHIGITGPPGAGKSTLVEALTKLLRQQDKTVGVLVVDPSSPFTGGAILGDRVRMRDHFLDPGVFIRSMATRGATGGLSAIVPSALRVLDAAGLDVILVETAGVGQTELDIMNTVDTVVVTVVPEAGDAIQTMKAGLLEIADIFVVNKADRQGAKRMATDLETTAHLGSRDMDWWTIPVLQTQATLGAGVTDLLNALTNHYKTLVDTNRLELRRAAQRRAELQTALRDRLLHHLDQAEHSTPLTNIIQQVESGHLPPQTAADQILANLAPRAKLSP